MKKISAIILVLVLAPVMLFGADPMATDFTFDQCCGSLSPYPVDIKSVACPDTLIPVFINHVGRHGARFPASDTFCKTLLGALDQASQQGTLTALGRDLRAVTSMVIDDCSNRWGALDSLGEYEQRMIAYRMYSNFPQVFEKGRVHAISSYSPRCMMSMYCFNHQLDRLNNKIEFTTSTGRANSPLLRPFDNDPEFTAFIKGDEVMDIYDSYFKTTCPVSAIERVLGANFAYESEDQKRDLAITEYYVLASLGAMSVDCDLQKYFTRQEINALWSCFNLRQYLQRTATTLSMLPADIASDLILDLVNTTDDFINDRSNTTVRLRFGHAETLMPLLSLLHLKGCFYLTNYFDTVAKNWQDFNVVPMAANLQLILFKHKTKDIYYLRTDLNECPVPLVQGSKEIYTPWAQAKAYMMHCVPTYNVNK